MVFRREARPVPVYIFAMAYIPDNARWYLADIVLELVIEGDSRNVVHTNLLLIEAASPEQAYEKALALARAGEHSYTKPKASKSASCFAAWRT